MSVVHDASVSMGVKPTFSLLTWLAGCSDSIDLPPPVGIVVAAAHACFRRPSGAAVCCAGGGASVV